MDKGDRLPAMHYKRPGFPSVEDLLMDRRGMLTMLGAGALAVIAGCGGTQGEGTPSSRENIPDKSRNEASFRENPCPGAADGGIDMFPDAGPFCPDETREIKRPSYWRSHHNTPEDALVKGRPPSSLATPEDIDRVRALEEKVRSLENGKNGFPDAGN